MEGVAAEVVMNHIQRGMMDMRRQFLAEDELALEFRPSVVVNERNTPRSRLKISSNSTFGIRMRSINTLKLTITANDMND